MPDCVDQAGYLSWVQSLPNSNPPTWLGLPPTAEGHMLTAQGGRVLSKLMMLQDVLGAADDSGAAAADVAPTPTVSSTAGGASGKLKVLLGTVEGWLGALGKATGGAARDGMRAPAALTVLERCLSREVDVGRGLVGRLEADLRAAAALLRGQSKASKATRDLVGALAVDSTPKEWARAAPGGAQGMGAGAFVADLCRRARHAQELLRLVVGGTKGRADMRVWLGGLFYPEAFITATRQATAQRLKCSLEDLGLLLHVDDGSPREGAFAITDLTLEGAAWEGGQLRLTTAIHCALPLCWLDWVGGWVCVVCA
jgi:dynein heavy chain 1